MNDVSDVLLSGVVGSTAYGLAVEGSDVDRLGMFAAPTKDLLSLSGYGQESVVTVAPDSVFHEARKYLWLVINGNPTAMELLWLESYETITPLGAALVGLRTKLLSRQRVRDAYLGYAAGQFRKLEVRGDGSFSSDTRKRTAKHARHLMRLCLQGYELYSTGELHLRLSDPAAVTGFGEAVAAGDLDVARQLMTTYEQDFDRATSVLPEHPDAVAAGAWLLDVRRQYLVW